MSCQAALSAALLWLAAQPGVAAVASPEPPPMTGSAVAHEPLFADIIARAASLKTLTETLARTGGPVPDDFEDKIRALAELDMKAHTTLRERGVDGDLTCILKGIAEDLPIKLAALKAAREAKDRQAALADMTYLLNDNVEVITAPPKPPA